MEHGRWGRPEPHEWIGCTGSCVPTPLQSVAMNAIIVLALPVALAACGPGQENSRPASNAGTAAGTAAQGVPGSAGMASQVPPGVASVAQPALIPSMDGRAPMSGGPSSESSRVTAASCAGAASEGLAQSVTGRASQAQSCYDEALKTDRTLRGKISVRLRVEQNGSVSECRVLSSDMPEAMNACVVRLLSAPGYVGPGTGCIDVTVPMVFVPREADGGTQAMR
jgi:hypothetical protein